MALKNRLAKLIIDPAFRKPALLKFIFALDDLTGIDLVRALAPVKIMPASAELFQRCFAHFVAGEEISLYCSMELAKIAPDEAARKYLLIQADEERAHLAHFRVKLAQFGLSDDKLSRFVSPNFNKFRTTIERAIERGDFLGALIGNNLVVEGLAICLLEYGCMDMRANSDEIAKFMDFVLEDERHHVRFGERRLLRMVEREEIDAAHAEDIFGEMWGHASKAIAEIPDVLDAMGLKPGELTDKARGYYQSRLSNAGLSFAF